MQKLENEKWLDQKTRVIALTWHTYNTNLKLLEVYRVVWNFKNSGYIDVCSYYQGMYFLKNYIY